MSAFRGSEDMRRESEVTCIFDLLFDIPHPAASPLCERAKIIEPPGNIHPDVMEIYDPQNISRIPKFAFPDYDEEADYEQPRINDSTLILNKYDIGCFSSNPMHHTFSLLLDSGCRIHGHVLRYLPLHPSVRTRFDVGRRGERAMILITRSVGGIRFYASLLKTLQALSVEATIMPPEQIGNHDLVKAFLHDLYKQHLLLRKKHADNVREKGFKKMLREDELKIIMRGTELYFLTTRYKQNQQNQKDLVFAEARQFFKKHDYLSFMLPLSLQPGYYKSDFPYECEDLYTPILPLLRCLGPAKIIRILSALLCENRIIFVSGKIETLSACVRACTAMLSQGLLVWRHVQIPVLPPHLLRYLSTPAPYIVGILERYSVRVESIGLKDVLYINLDSAELKTLDMKNPIEKIPDLLIRKRRNKNYNACEELSGDFSSILATERDTYGADSFADGNPHQETKDSIDDVPRKKSIAEKLGLVKGNKKNGVNTFFETAASMVGTMLGSEQVAKSAIDDSEFDKQIFKYRGNGKSKGFHEYLMNENERSEEMARASLVCFFLEIFGDMGMYLTMDQSTGKFRLDTKKFLVRKRQMGAKEDTSVFKLIHRLTRSVMFEKFTSGRISDVEKIGNKQHVHINHTPLFLLCQTHLRRHKTKFTTQNIRKVVFTTIAACPERKLIDMRDEVRQRALALTSEKQFDGDEVAALTSIINVCKDCDQCFRQVMQVIWLRIRDDRPTMWKHVLLGIHLLRNFLLHGPITTVASSIGSFERIRDLMDYTGRTDEITRTVQVAAGYVYTLLKNMCRLFLRRRKLLTLKLEKSKSVTDSVRWSSYLIRRLPPDVKFDKLHSLMRPDESCVPIENRRAENHSAAVASAQVAVQRDITHQKTKHQQRTAPKSIPKDTKQYTEGERDPINYETIRLPDNLEIENPQKERTEADSLMKDANQNAQYMRRSSISNTTKKGNGMKMNGGYRGFKDDVENINIDCHGFEEVKF